MQSGNKTLRAEPRKPARGEVAVFFACAVTAACALGITLSAARPGGAAALAPVTATVEVVVAPGDTLWSIARKHVAREVDLRAAVDDIVARNRLSSTTLQPGQVLVVGVDGTLRRDGPRREAPRSDSDRLAAARW